VTETAEQPQQSNAASGDASDHLLSHGDLGLSLETTVATLFGMCGWQDLEVNVAEGVLSVGGAHEVGALTLRDVAMVVPFLPAALNTAYLHDDRENGRALEVSLDLFRVWSAEVDELPKSAAYVELICKARLDGRPLVPTDTVRKWVGVVAGDQLDRPFAVQSRNLKTLLKLSQRVDDRVLAESVESLMRATRCRALDMPVAEDDSAQLDPGRFHSPRGWRHLRVLVAPRW